MSGPREDDAAERAEALEEWLEEVDARAREGVPLLVEGDKDEATLRRLGIRGAIVRIHGAGPLLTLAEGLAATGASEVILLSDWDRTGGRLARRLMEVFAACGVRADPEPRARLARIAREIRHVESLDTYLATLRRRAGSAPGEG